MRIIRHLKRFCIFAAPAALWVAAAASAQPIDLISIADFEGDGHITLDEYIAYESTMFGLLGGDHDILDVGRLPPFLKPIFNGTPADARGRLTRQAFIDSAPARFKAADKNGAGWLTPSELRASQTPTKP